MEVDVTIMPTPNPNAFKFITNQKVKAQGTSTYRSPMECGENKLALELFAVRGVDQVHIFDNTVTITKFGYEDWEEVETKVIEVIETKLPEHNPEYKDFDPEEDRRAKLTPELKEIEAVLDRTIRPGLQADGGDIHCLSYEDDVLLIQYQGACGTCPSSTTGTLYAIKGILRDEYNPDIDVYIAPEY